MKTNKDLLMQPLTDEELASVSGGVTGGTNAECEAECSRYKQASQAVYMKCYWKCLSCKSTGKNL
jgi:bacteriocin-like protein